MQKLLYITFEPKPEFKIALQDEFELHEIIFTEIKNNIDEFLKNKINEIKPDIILKEDIGTLILNQKTYKCMIVSRAKLVQWTQDVIKIDSLQANNILEFSKLGALSLFSNYINIDWLKSKGYEAGFLAPSVDFNIYKQRERIVRYRGVSFIGNNLDDSTTLGKYRQEMVSFLEDTYKDEFSLWGQNWFKGNGYVGGILEAEAYSESLMAINISQYKDIRYSSDRIFKLIGCKCLCLNYDYPGCDVDFPYVVNWKTLSDLKYIINYYQKNPEERVALVNKAYEHLVQNHTWKNRVQQFKYLIDKHGNY